MPDNNGRQLAIFKSRENILMKILVLVLALVVSAAALANPSNKWRLQFSGDAKTSGVIVIQLSPVGSDPISVSIDVPDNTSGNKVAKIVTGKLKEAFLSDAFHVERDDGEDVLVKAHHGAAKFDLEVASNSVEHVRINPDRE
jgi:hypothetical protein